MRRRQGWEGRQRHPSREHSRRAQAEIIGLALIVILIAIGFLLYVKFSLTGAGTSARESFEQTNLTLEKHLQYIADGNPRCSSPGHEEVIHAFLNETLNRTLSSWGINYRLVIVTKRVGTSSEDPIASGFPNFTNPLYPANERCSDRMDRNADHYEISVPPSYTKTVEIRLERC